MNAIQLTLLALSAVCVRASQVSVFGVHQNGTYWGANIDLSGSASNVKFSLYPTFSQTTGTVSYDPVTGQSLFELFKPHQMAYGPMCTNSHGFRPKVLFNMSDIMIERPEIGTAVAGKISAFAMYDSQIYFLHYGNYLDDDQEVYHIFQIRKFLSCEECNVDPYQDGQANPAFELSFSVGCSQQISDGITFSTLEDYNIYSYEFEGGKSLKVSKQAGSDDLHFYFQVGRIKLSDSGDSSLDMFLYKASSSAATEEIHQQSVTQKYYAWKMPAIGSVDYKNGLVCWSTAERVFCRQDEGEVMEVVGQFDAVTNQICRGNDAAHISDISGVSIVHNHDNKQVVAFGCSPSSSQVKGAGIVTIDQGNKVLQALQAGNEQLSAGSVVSVQALQESCTYEPRPAVCVRLEKTTIPPPTTTQEARPEPTKDMDKPDIKDGTGEVIDGKPVSGTDDQGSSADRATCTSLVIINSLLLTALALLLS